MTTNQQRAGVVLAEVEQHVDFRQRQRILTTALADAEARGRAKAVEESRRFCARSGGCIS